jgi:K+-transporting ATPase ATPase C chain
MLTHLRPALVLFAPPLAHHRRGLPARHHRHRAGRLRRQGQRLDPHRCDAGKPIGSALIGQEFGPPTQPPPPQHAKWFWGRPSATGPVPYTALNLDAGTGSSGSNLAPTNPALLDNVKARLAASTRRTRASASRARHQRRARPTPPPRRGPPPSPSTLSPPPASGLDPHISPAAAEYQVRRIAKARNMTEDAVRDLVRQHTTAAPWASSASRW